MPTYALRVLARISRSSAWLWILSMRSMVLLSRLDCGVRRFGLPHESFVESLGQERTREKGILIVDNGLSKIPGLTPLLRRHSRLPVRSHGVANDAPLYLLTSALFWNRHPRIKMTKTPRKKIQPFDYSELDLEPDKLAIVKRCEAELAKLGRRTTEETFEFGEQLAIAAELIPERTFGKWAVSASRYTRQHVSSLIKIAIVLKDHKARLIQARVPATIMGKLAASPGHLPQVLAEFEGGHPLTGTQVDAIIGGEKDVPASDLPNAGGIAGLRANAQAKLKLGISEFARNVAEIMGCIETALVPALEGKRVLKGQLADKIERLARLTRFQLENVVLFVELNPNNSAAIQVLHFPEGSKWRGMEELLWVLGGRDSWPRDELATWLSADVLPLLAWSIEGGKGTKKNP